MDNRLKIINKLGKNLDREYTMHELSKSLAIPYASFYRTIKTMDSLVTTRKLGKATIIGINSKNPIVKSYLAISSEEEKKEYMEDYPLIKKIANEMESSDTALLFGSYAKRDESEKSDIDIMVINRSGDKTLTFSKYEIIFKKKINPVFVKEKEFKSMIKDDDENVGKQALRNHIILNNPQAFWELVIDGI